MIFGAEGVDVLISMMRRGNVRTFCTVREKLEVAAAIRHIFLPFAFHFVVIVQYIGDDRRLDFSSYGKSGRHNDSSQDEGKSRNKTLGCPVCMRENSEF